MQKNTLNFKIKAKQLQLFHINFSNFGSVYKFVRFMVNEEMFSVKKFGQLATVNCVTIILGQRHLASF
jgi:hypothetical protein